jgi:hypothetical protein
MQKAFPWIAAAVVILIWGFYNKSAEASKGSNDCISRRMFSDEIQSKCQCVGRLMANQINFSYYLPVAGPIFFSPRPSDVQIMARNSINQCS